MSVAREQPVSRGTLYEKVWSQPMIHAAKEYGVSSNYLARVCQNLNVPRPARGYWAKKAAGRKVVQPPLPDPQPGDALEWRRDGVPPSHVEMRPRPPEKPARRRRSKGDRPEEHRLVRGTKEFFLLGRETDNGYLRPNKLKLIDLVVSRAALDRGLQIASDLYLTLEEYDLRVSLSPNQPGLHRDDVEVHEKTPKRHGYVKYWYPYGPTVVFVGTVAVGITLYEIAEEIEVMWVGGKYMPVADVNPRARNRHEYSWTSTESRPSGRFRLKIYSPYRNTSWQQSWEVTAQRDIERLAVQVARALPEYAREISQLVEEERVRAEEERRLWEEQCARWELEAKARRKAEAVKKSKEELFSIMARWAELQQIAAFLAEVEGKLSALGSDERLVVLERLNLAREMIGEIDALKDLKRWRTPEEREPG